MTRRKFEALAWQAIAGLPDVFRPCLEEVVLVIRSRPSRKVRRELGIPRDEDLLGLYEGPDLAERSVADIGRFPSRIILFYEPLLEACETEAELVEEIRKTILHEIGHHFGMDEEQLDRLGYG